MKIPLTQGCFAIFDEDDYELISARSWQVKHFSSTLKYAKSEKWNQATKKKTALKMHRVIMGVTDPKIEVDHINGNGLDNRKSNLRLCNSSQNKPSVRLKVTNKSGYTGVHWVKAYQKWGCSVTSNGKSYHMGYHKNKHIAARLRNCAARILHGKFAYQNVLPEKYAGLKTALPLEHKMYYSGPCPFLSHDKCIIPKHMGCKYSSFLIHMGCDKPEDNNGKP